MDRCGKSHSDPLLLAEKVSLPQSEPGIRWWRHKRFWRWTGACAGSLTLAYVVLFFLGRNSPHYRPDPTTEGRLLSQWANDIKGYEALPDDLAHHKAVEVLRTHKTLVMPALIGWLDERDSLPETVYFFTTQWADELLRPLPGASEYYGAHQNHRMAACALRAMGDRDAAVIAALRRAEDHYEGTRYFVRTDIHNALQKLSADDAVSIPR